MGLDGIVDSTYWHGHCGDERSLCATSVTPWRYVSIFGLSTLGCLFAHNQGCSKQIFVGIYHKEDVFLWYTDYHALSSDSTRHTAIQHIRTHFGDNQSDIPLYSSLVALLSSLGVEHKEAWCHHHHQLCVCQSSLDDSVCMAHTPRETDSVVLSWNSTHTHRIIPQQQKITTMKVLIIRLSALGDVAMTLPVVYSIAKAHPDVEFDMLTRPFFSRLFICPPSNVRLVVADYKGEHRGMKGTLKLLNMLRNRHYDAVADLHNVSRSWTIDWALRLLGSRVEMVDKMRRGRKDIINCHKAQPNFIDRYQDVFQRLGLTATLTFRSLFEDKEIKTPIPVEKTTIGIAPFARYQNKALPLHQLKALVSSLTNRHLHVMLFGGRGREAELLAEVAHEVEGCESVAGRFQIEEELAIMHNLALMLSMDSANQHLASIAGTRVMTLWGSTTPLCGFAPYHQNDDMAILRHLDCQPCTIAGSNQCRLNTFECLSEMDMETVAKRIEQAVSQTESSNTAEH